MKTTKRKKRPADANQLAKFIVDVAIGEKADIEEVSELKSKAGKKGAKARAKALTEAERSEIAKIAASARWKKSD